MKVKNICSYILEFISSIILLLVITLTVFKMTVFNTTYVKKNLEKTNYYQKLNTSIKNEMKNYIIQSGLNNSILEDIFTKDKVKEDIYYTIDCIYQGKDISLDTTSIKKNLTQKIVSYLKKENIQVTNQSDLDLFVEQMMQVYKEEIILFSNLSYPKKIVSTLNTYLGPILLVSIAIFIVLFILAKILTKRQLLPTIFFTSSISLSFIVLYLKRKIDIKNFLFMSQDFSDFIEYTFYNITNIFLVISSILIISGIILIIIKDSKLLKKKN